MARIGFSPDCAMAQRMAVDFEIEMWYGMWLVGAPDTTDPPAPRSRGVRVLGRGALITAYILFVVAFGTLGVVLYSVITSEVPTEEVFAAAQAAGETVGENL